MPSPNLVYEQVPIRLELAITSNPPVAPIDANTGQQPRFWRGSTISMQLGIFQPDLASVDLTNLSQIQFVLQNAADSLVPLAVVTVLAADITKTITRADWLAGVAQQASGLFSAAITDQGLGGTDEAEFWLIVQGLTNASAPIVYGAGPVTIVLAGSAVPFPTGYTSRHAQESDTVNFTVTPTSQLPTEVVTIGGIARTSNGILGITGMQDGARLDLVVNLPATAGITINIRSGLVSNPIISTLTTGSVLQALLQYYFDANAQAWIPKFYALPPT